MKNTYFILISFAIILFSNISKADVTYSTVAIPAANVNAGSGDNIVYMVKVDVTNTSVTSSTMQFIFSGTHDANDLTVLDIYTNTTPSLTGATNRGSASATFAAPHTYNINYTDFSIPANTTLYFIIAYDVSSGANGGNTIQINGLANPVTFTYTAAQTEVNNQTNTAGPFTIFAASVTVSTETVASANVAQSAVNNVVYVAKMDVTGLSVTVASLNFTLSGSYDNNDLSAYRVSIGTTPVFASSTNIYNNSSVAFAGPHLFDANFSDQTIPAGQTRYFFIYIDVSATATNGNTFDLDGAVNPVNFTFTTAPTVSNNQTDGAGTFTLQAAGVSISTETVSGANVAQSAINTVVYVAKMDVTTTPVTVGSLNFTLTGSYDNNDLSAYRVSIGTTPVFASSTNIYNNSSVAFAGPHLFDANFSDQTIPAGQTRYFFIYIDVSATATNGNTFEVDGAVNPVNFIFTTAPTVTNNQTDGAGTFTLQAAGVSISTETVAGANVAQSAVNTVVYVTKMDVTTTPVTVGSLNFTLSGSYDNNDLSAYRVSIGTTPVFASSTNIYNNGSMAFAGPHLFDANFSDQTIPAGQTRYFFIYIDVSATATNGNTFDVDGAVNPVNFTFTTAPTVTNNQTDGAGTFTLQAAGVSISTESVASATVAQSAINTVVYVAKMDVTTTPVTVGSLNFTLTGSYDNNDLSAYRVSIGTTPVFASSTNIYNNGSVAFAGPHLFDANFSDQTIPAGQTRYFFIYIDVSATATNGNTFDVDGAINPVNFTFTTAPTVTNNQTDGAGTFTILSAGVSISTETVASANVAQSAINTVVYVAKMDVTGLPVTVGSLNFMLSGSYDNNDLSAYRVSIGTTPVFASSTNIYNNGSVAFAGPHLFDANFSDQTIPAGQTRYFFIYIDVSSSATNGNTFEVDGAVNPVNFTFTTAPTLTNSQTDGAGTFTIQVANIALSSVAVSSATVPQGSTSNIVYIAKMDVTGLPVTISSVNYTFGGTVDANDLVSRHVYMNTTPTIGGTAIVNNQSVGIAAPHTFNTNISQQTIPAGETRYFIYTFNVDNSANNGNTFEMDGALNPVSFGFTTSPTITNNQTDAAGTYTIQAPGVTISSEPVIGGNASQSSTNNITYIAKVVVSGLPVTINSINYTLGGNVDNNDLSARFVYMNTTPTIGGTAVVNNQPSGVQAPTTFNTNINSQTIPAGETRYFIFTFNVSATGTNGNTFEMDGLNNPISFGYTTSPAVTNNQTDVAGFFTIGSPAATITTVPVTAGGFLQGSTENILYIAKMDVTNLPTTVNNIIFTLTGTHDANDLAGFKVYANDTPDLVTPTNLLGGIGNAGFAAPHTYNQQLNGALVNAGETKFFIITLNLNTEANSNSSNQNSRNAAEIGNTIILDGAANPVVFGFSNGPTITDNQSNLAAVQSIESALPVTLISFSGKNLGENKIELTWKTANERNFDHFEIQRSVDAKMFEKIGEVKGNNEGNYSYLDNSPLTPRGGINNPNISQPNLNVNQSTPLLAAGGLYRLKMIDLDGSFAYSKIINVVLENTKNQIVAFPNPVINNLTIEIQSIDNEIVTLFFIDNLGKVIDNKTVHLSKGNNQLSWNTQSIAAGNYLLSDSKSKFGTKRISKQ